MKNVLWTIVVGIIVSCYFYSFSFTFLPAALNTKLIMAMISVPILILKQFRDRDVRLSVSRGLIGAILLALFFSIACLISVQYNNTADYSYASYMFSFFTWLGGAYTACMAIRALHGEVTIKLLTAYLAGVSAFQCILAIIIDQVPAVQSLVDAFIAQGVEYLHDVNRLYGIGASLDLAGTRFSIVLIMIIGVLTRDTATQTSRWQIGLFLFSFFTIAMLGNIMSRTTGVGLVIGLILLLASSKIFNPVISGEKVKLYGMLFTSIFLATGIFIYLYNTDSYFHSKLHYGFEGMFNWLDTGVWRTDSTDKLNAVMWIWPTDTKTWWIGSGLFGNFVYSTDIGYCRLVLYCGLIGFGLFALFFIYNPLVIAARFQKYTLMFLALLMLTFAIWMKVATDIFLVYALFYCLDDPADEADDEMLEAA